MATWKDFRKKRKAGRPPVFVDEECLMEWFNDYLDECEEKDINASLAGFARAVDVSKLTLINMQKESHPLHIPMTKVMTFLEDHALNNSMNDQMKMFFLKNTFKEYYRDKQEIETINTNMNSDIHNLSDDDKDKRLEELLDSVQDSEDKDNE